MLIFKVRGDMRLLAMLSGYFGSQLAITIIFSRPQAALEYKPQEVETSTLFITVNLIIGSISRTPILSCEF